MVTGSRALGNNPATACGRLVVTRREPHMAAG